MNWKNIVRQWNIMTFYQRFESVIALLLTMLIILVVIVASYRLFAGIINGLILDQINPLDHKIFQNVFGEIMTVLIALEFNHTLQFVVTRQQSIIQTKVIYSSRYSPSRVNLLSWISRRHRQRACLV